ncbi:MAG: ThuA domain-containing protein [Planctomycetota bacterium]|nr:MAG: ThuA domain-containing protein [Planctomycetota bacterium]
MNLMLTLVLLATFWAALLAAETPEPNPQPAEPFGVLVFTKTAGFRHASIPAGTDTVEKIGLANGFMAFATEDAAVFTDDSLARFAVIVFLNTTGDILDDDQQAAMERFIRAGGGFVGIHSAADTEYGWPWYAGLVGAQFRSHPPVQQAEIEVIDRDHPSTRHLPERWTRTDEWYDYRSAPAGTVRLLMTLDQSTYEGSVTEGTHPIAWCHTYEGGRAFYTGGGHTSEAFREPDFRNHLLGAIRWAAGRTD